MLQEKRMKNMKIIQIESVIVHNTYILNRGNHSYVRINVTDWKVFRNILLKDVMVFNNERTVYYYEFLSLNNTS